MTAALRDGILAALVAHDPLREASDGDAVEPYAFEADELATILAGSAADAGTCAVAVWAVLGGAAFGHPHACAALGDEIALVLDRHPGADADPELWDEADADDADGPDEAEYAELGDALGTAVLMALITRDPYALGRVEMAVDWHAAYAPLAVDVVLRLRGESEPLATTIDLVRDGALGQPACPPADELDVRLQLLAEDLREVARAVSYALAADDIAAEVDPDADDPLVAGVRSILERHDPAGDAVQRSGYGDIAAGVAECLREATEADAELCARVVWTELRRWGDPSRVGEVAGAAAPAARSPTCSTSPGRRSGCGRCSSRGPCRRRRRIASCAPRRTCSPSPTCARGARARRRLRGGGGARLAVGAPGRRRRRAGTG